MWKNWQIVEYFMNTASQYKKLGEFIVYVE